MLTQQIRNPLYSVVRKGPQYFFGSSICCNIFQSFLPNWHGFFVRTNDPNTAIKFVVDYYQWVGFQKNGFLLFHIRKLQLQYYCNSWNKKMSIAILECQRFDAIFATESAYQTVSAFCNHLFCELAKITQAEQSYVYTVLLNFLVALIRYQTWRLFANILKQLCLKSFALFLSRQCVITHIRQTQFCLTLFDRLVF